MSLARRIAYCTAFAIAMAYVESAVVLYLRLLVNDSHTLFPLKPVPPDIYRAEFVREGATIVMLSAVALLQSRRPRVAGAYFLYCFGIWDIFYYVWLEVLIGWPHSILSWDILFFIPLPWFSPVLSPVIVSLLFIAGALVILWRENRSEPIAFRPVDFALFFVGALLILASYLVELPQVERTGSPGDHPWWLFLLGIAGWIGAFARGAAKGRKRSRAKDKTADSLPR